MKRFVYNFSALVVVAVAVISLGACATPDKNEEREFKWATHILFQYELVNGTTIDETGEAAIKSGIQTAIDDENVRIEIADRTLVIAVLYEGIMTLRFTSSENVFFKHQTVRFDNPLPDIIEEDGIAATIDTAIRGTPAGEDGTPAAVAPLASVTSKQQNIVLVVDLPLRPTSVTGSIKSEMVAADDEIRFRHYIDTPVAEIKVMWRFANQTTWYISAIVITVAVVGGIFLFLRIKSLKETGKQSQAARDIVQTNETLH